MKIDVFSDPVCPWCFIGKRRLERALDERKLGDTVSIQWRTFQLNPGMPPEGMERDAYLALKFGGSERAVQIYETIREAGQVEGIAFAFDRIERTPNTINAHRLIRYAARSERDGEVMEALFSGYFLEGRDIGDDTALADIAGECGLDRAATLAFLSGTEDTPEVRAEHDFAVSLNITGVPCFIVEGRYAVVGAQEPDAFMPVFDLVEQEARKSAAGS